MKRGLLNLVAMLFIGSGAVLTLFTGPIELSLVLWGALTGWLASVKANGEE